MPAPVPDSRKPLAAPLTWLQLLEPAGDGDGQPGPGREHPIPGQHLPRIETVEYMSKLIVLILLLLALPWLVGKLLTAPGDVVGHTGVGVTAAAGA